ncbi:PucR family transcriptional regulator [Enterococcus sp. LJL98]
MKTLQDLLNTPRFSDLMVLSAHKSLDHPVESAEITETPDVANYIPKNTIILTTAMSYKENQSGLKKMILELKEHEVAALGIKVGRFLKKLDPEILAYAEEVDLPIIKVPDTQPLGALLHEMLSYLWNDKTQQMSYAFDIQNRFSDLLMHDVSNARFIAEFGKIINVPIILLSPWHKIMAHSRHFSDEGKPASHYIHQLSAEDFQRIDREQASFILQEPDGKSIQMTSYPIKVNHYFPFYLMILTPEKIPYPISEFAIDQAILVLTLMLYKNQEVQKSLAHLKTDFYAQLIDAKMNHQPRNWLDLGKSYGLVKSKSYQMAIGYCLANEETENHLRYKKEEGQLVANWLNEYLPLRLKDVAVFKLRNTNNVFLLFQSTQENTEQLLTHLIEELGRILPITLRFAFGNTHERVEEIGDSYIEALAALETTKQLLHPPMIQYYQPKGLDGLFEKLNLKDIHYFCEHTLQVLAYPTDPALIELRKTLKSFLGFNCEITKTANALYLHRNTIKYRIKQCEELLGLSVQNPENSLALRIALELSENQATT